MAQLELKPCSGQPAWIQALTARNWAVFCGKGMAGKGSQATRGSWGGRERIPAEASGLGWQEARWEGM